MNLIMNRRKFIKSSALVYGFINVVGHKESFFGTDMEEEIEIRIRKFDSDFEREKLRIPLGLKGGYLTELWQVAVMLSSEMGMHSIGLGTQSVLYGDPNIFEEHTEANGNAIMFALTNQALAMLSKMKITNPMDTLELIIPELYHKAKQITNRSDLNINFVYNACVSVDNALWMLYAKENKLSTFYDLFPEKYKDTFSYKNQKVAIMYQIPYDMKIEDIEKAADNGYFIFKFKTGAPGSQEEMLVKDCKRLTEVHNVLKGVKTSQTLNGKVYYTMDANARYDTKERLNRYLDHAKKIGAFEHILLYEEPFVESNNEDVSDIGVMIAADESIHTVEDAMRKIKLGYSAFVLKGIAKTLSLTAQIAKVANDHGIPCLCADLTVNPILIDWNKNIAGSIAPFPQLGMGMMETNGDMNYINWDDMFEKHPMSGAEWTKVKQGVFELDDDFYASSGGIFDTSSYYQQFFKK